MGRTRAASECGAQTAHAAPTERVHETFVAGADPSDLLRDAKILQTLYQSMEEALPAGLINGNLVRHLHLLEYYLEQGQPEACRNDIDDICRTDLPRMAPSMRRVADAEVVHGDHSPVTAKAALCPHP